MLSGAHSTKGLLKVREEMLKAGIELPDQVETVEADILTHTTPIQIRRAIAGDEQYRQGNVSKIPCSEFLRNLAQWKPTPGRNDMVYQVADCVQICGYKRMDSQVCFFLLDAAAADCVLFIFSQRELLKEYRHLVLWANQYGEAVSEAVLNMERNIHTVTFNLLRDLRGIMTPNARDMVLPVMNAATVTLKAFKKAVQEAQHAMWADWHWHQAPDDVIHPTKSMPHSLSEFLSSWH